MLVPDSPDDFGPSVGLRHSGFEQVHPARCPVDRFVACVKSSLLLNALVRLIKGLLAMHSVCTEADFSLVLHVKRHGHALKVILRTRHQQQSRDRTVIGSTTRKHTLDARFADCGIYFFDDRFILKVCFLKFGEQVSFLVRLFTFDINPAEILEYISPNISMPLRTTF